MKIALAAFAFATGLLVMLFCMPIMMGAGAHLAKAWGLYP